MQINQKKVTIFLIGLFYSAIIGVLLSLFYLLQTVLIEMMWPGATFRPVINTLIILGVGAMLIKTRQRWGALPQNFGKIMADLDQTKTADYRYVLLQLVVPAIILISGTSLGPEATLVSSTVLFSVWLTDKQRYLNQYYQQFTVSGWRQKCKWVLIPHRYLLSASMTTTVRVRQMNWRNQLLAVLYFMNGILWFTITFQLTQQASLIMRLGRSEWQLHDLWWCFPLVIFGILMGKIWLQGMVLLRKTIQARVFKDHWLVVLGGASILIASLVLPEILFSGQHNFHLFTTTLAQASISRLLLISLGKLILLTICLNTGWLGGDIFPVLFASTAQGLALSQLLPQVDHLLVIATFTVAMGSTILAAPLVAGSLMAILFLPVNLLPIAVGVTLILVLLKRYRGQLVEMITNQLKLSLKHKKRLEQFLISDKQH